MVLAKRLLTRFGSVSGVREADAAALNDAVGAKAAEAIRAYFEARS